MSINRTVFFINIFEIVVKNTYLDTDIHRLIMTSTECLSPKLLTIGKKNDFYPRRVRRFTNRNNFFGRRFAGLYVFSRKREKMIQNKKQAAFVKLGKCRIAAYMLRSDFFGEN